MILKSVEIKTSKRKTVSLFFIIVLLIPLSECLGMQLELEAVKIDQQLLLEDLETLHNWIIEAHGDPYRFTSKKIIEAQFDRTKDLVREKNSLTLYEFHGEVMKIMALLKDGHSSAFLPTLDRMDGKVFFPLRIRFIDYRPYIIQNLSDQKIPIGSELVEINGQSTSELFKNLSQFIHRDGNIKLVRYRKMESNFYLSLLFNVFGVASNTYSVKIRLEDGSNKILRLEAIDQATAKNRSISIGKKSEILEFKMLNETEKIGYLKVSSFNTFYFEDNYKTYTDKIDDLMSEVSLNNVETLILDLRNNRGGEDSYSLYLLRNLMGKTFSHYGSITFRRNDYKFLPDGTHWDIPKSAYKKNKSGTYDATDELWNDGLGPSALGEFEPLKSSYKGKMVVLINAGTFSAGSSVAAHLHYSQRAIFIGEETSGSYIGSVAGFTPTIDLPNSKIMINLSLMNIRRPFFDKAWTDGGVIPDIHIEPTIQDILNNTDSVLERAVKEVSN